MEEFPVKVSGVLKTGHKIPEFPAFAFSATRDGWEFVTYPEQRGYKTLITICRDSVASLSITAPEMMFERYAPPTAAPAPPAYPTGDPQHSEGPKTHLSAFNRTRTPEGAPRAVPLADRDAPAGMGRPMSVIAEFDKNGEQRDVPVGAAMVKM